LQKLQVMKDALQRIPSRLYLPLFAVITLVISGIAILAFADDNPNEQAAGGMPAPQVEIVTVQPQSVHNWSEYSGRVAAVERAEVRPLVGGTITQVLFEESGYVKKGDPLFVIDPRPYEAAAANARAAVKSAQARVNLAAKELERARPLVKTNVLSKSVLDNRISEYEAAVAALDAARAAERQAALDVEYANVKAPISGQAGRAELTVGNSVEAGGNAPVLTTIVANDKMYVEFDVDERTYVTALRDQQQGKMQPVELRLSSLPDKTYSGTLFSFDNRLNPNTGTIRARAVFDNTDKIFIPGMYADVKLGSAEASQQILLPQTAIGTDQDRKFVMVVDEKNIAQYTPVTLGSTVNDQRVVLSGLKQGDRVITKGLALVRPGVPVNVASPAPPEQAAEKKAG
jgi:membrane fusion protein, multidrug efflux system